MMVVMAAARAAALMVAATRAVADRHQRAVDQISMTKFHFRE
jgi:hypothetical protein